MEILITGAIGDFITVESFIPESQVKKIKKVYLATPKHKLLIELFKLLPNWKNIETEVIYDDWTNIPYIENKVHLGNILENKPKSWDKIIDYSIFTIFKPDLLPKFKGSSFIKNKISEIKQNLPDNFIVIAPNSVMRSQAARKDIDQVEWKKISNYLIQTDQYAVVLGVKEQDYNIPSHFRIKNLMGLTTIEESIEILKKANGFIGIDSFLSVLAAQLFEKDKLLIKSFSIHVMFSKAYYYAPHKKFDFISIQVFPFKHSNLISLRPALYLSPELALSYSKDIAFQINMDNLVPYEYDYFQKYVNYKNTDISKKLNKFRVGLTKKYSGNGKVLDIGIGSGEFIQKIKNNVFGFDINPYGINWLKENKKYLNPYYDDISDIKVITLWDAIEHMANPCSLLNKIKKNQIVILTLPIFEDLKQLYSSKHFRINEHLYYWTNDSFMWYMQGNGFKFLEMSNQENKCGRQGVNTFVFKKDKELDVFSFGQFILNS